MKITNLEVDKRELSFECEVDKLEAFGVVFKNVIVKGLFFAEVDENRSVSIDTSPKLIDFHLEDGHMAKKNLWWQLEMYKNTYIKLDEAIIDYLTDHRRQ